MEYHNTQSNLDEATMMEFFDQAFSNHTTSDTTGHVDSVTNASPLLTPERLWRIQEEIPVRFTMLHKERTRLRETPQYWQEELLGTTWRQDKRELFYRRAEYNAVAPQVAHRNMKGGSSVKPKSLDKLVTVYAHNNPPQGKALTLINDEISTTERLFNHYNKNAREYELVGSALQRSAEILTHQT